MPQKHTLRSTALSRCVAGIGIGRARARPAVDDSGIAKEVSWEQKQLLHDRVYERPPLVVPRRERERERDTQSRFSKTAEKCKSGTSSCEEDKFMQVKSEAVCNGNTVKSTV